MFLTVGVVVLGLAAYLASFGPLLSINADIGPFGGAQFTASGLSYWTVAALVAALLAAVGLLPKSKDYTAIVAVTAVLGVLLVLGQAINRPNGFSDWLGPLACPRLHLAAGDRGSGRAALRRPVF